MARKGGKLRFFIEYAGMLVGYALLAWPPLFVSQFVARIMADAWRLLDGRHRRLALSQIMDRLGADAKEAARLVRDNYRHYTLLALEVARLRGMDMSEVMERTDLNACDLIMKDILRRGKGMILITGHLGNWEWGGVVMGELEAVNGAIARPQENPYINAFVDNIRKKTSVRVWSKFGGMRQALATVKRGRAFVAVLDQDGGREGCMVPFLGKRGSTMAVPIDMAIRTGAPIFVGAVVRAGETLRFRLVAGGVHWPRPGEEAERERLRLLTAVNADLSTIIRAYPEQWIWIHKRWKTRIDCA